MQEPMDNMRLRNILADEFHEAGLHYSARCLRDETREIHDGGLAIALRAMRRVADIMVQS